MIVLLCFISFVKLLIWTFITLVNNKQFLKLQSKIVMRNTWWTSEQCLLYVWTKRSLHSITRPKQTLLLLSIDWPQENFNALNVTIVISKSKVRIYNDDEVMDVVNASKDELQDFFGLDNSKSIKIHLRSSKEKKIATAS